MAGPKRKPQEQHKTPIPHIDMSRPPVKKKDTYRGSGPGPGGATNYGAIQAGQNKVRARKQVADAAIGPLRGIKTYADYSVGALGTIVDALSPPRKGHKYGVPPKKGNR